MVKIVAFLDIGQIKEFEYDFSNFPKIRKDYVNSISHEGRKRQSYFIFKLFLCVLKKYFNDFDVESLYESKGKWYLKNGPYFSFSHSNNIVAVCMSDECECVVDVEMCSDKIVQVSKLVRDIGSANTSIEKLVVCWTERECKIKERAVNVFSNIQLFDCYFNKYFLSFGFASNNNAIIYNAR